MSPRLVIAAGRLLRRPVHGSVLPEPSSQQVYEGRLPQAPVREVSLLDLTIGEPKGRLLPTDLRDDLQAASPSAVAWVPWCEECRLEPVDGPWTQDCAQYLAGQHDVVHHHAVRTAQVRAAAEVAALVAGGAR